MIANYVGPLKTIAEGEAPSEAGRGRIAAARWLTAISGARPVQIGLDIVEWSEWDIGRPDHRFTRANAEDFEQLVVIKFAHRASAAVVAAIPVAAIHIGIGRRQPPAALAEIACAFVTVHRFDESIR